MLDPLSDAVIEGLRTDKTSALAAALIVAGSFPEVLAFAARVIEGPRSRPAAPKRAARRDNGHDRGRTLQKRDNKLAELIRETPGLTIVEMARQLRAAQNTVRASLERLEIAGLVEHEGRSWRAAEPRPPVETPKWTAPVSAQGDRRRRAEAEEHAHA
jgi:hypothetical protein